MLSCSTLVNDIYLLSYYLWSQKDKQKKKRGTKGILLDAEGDATLEDLPNVSQGHVQEPSPDAERPKSSNKKVWIFAYPLLEV